MVDEKNKWIRNIKRNKERKYFWEFLYFIKEIDWWYFLPQVREYMKKYDSLSPELANLHNNNWLKELPNHNNVHDLYEGN